jgi:hypothetical protein
MTATSVVLADGTLEASGVTLADSVILGDGGNVVPDGTVLSDSVLSLTGAAALAMSVDGESPDPGDSIGVADPLVDP